MLSAVLGTTTTCSIHDVYPTANSWAAEVVVGASWTCKYTFVFCTVLYCTVLYVLYLLTVLYCTVLYCTVPYRTVLYRDVPCCTVLYRAVLCCTALILPATYDNPARTGRRSFLAWHAEPQICYAGRVMYCIIPVHLTSSVWRGVKRQKEHLRIQYLSRSMPPFIAFIVPCRANGIK